mmetsp:Transcript_12095/g.32476  ORF Transcript_12095/g.32476 Transcript_12095/m.32476 type:complete len:228 (+) Transcript_12095:146-829(+)
MIAAPAQAAAAEESQEERICRYCLSGPDDEDGELVAPCACRGGQRWVHRDCLIRWQRSVIVTQPTHPAFYEDDVRQRVCNVCRTAFDPPPPSRRELMASFTGPELAALLDVGCLIVCERHTAREMEEQMRASPFLRRRAGLDHWARGVYAITEVVPEDASDGEDCIVAVNVTRPIPNGALPRVLKCLAMLLLRRRRVEGAPAEGVRAHAAGSDEPAEEEEEEEGGVV